MRAIQSASFSPPDCASRRAMASSRASGATHQCPGPAVAVTPEVPSQPFSTSTTEAPARRAPMAAQAPAMPPPMTSTSAVR